MVLEEVEVVVVVVRLRRRWEKVVVLVRKLCDLPRINFVEWSVVVIEDEVEV